MIHFRTEEVRAEFHKLAPEVQMEIQGLAERFTLQGKSVHVNFVDRWGLAFQDYEISFRILDESKPAADDFDDT